MDGRGGGNDRRGGPTPNPLPKGKGLDGGGVSQDTHKEYPYSISAPKRLLPGVYAEVAVGEGEVHAHAAGVVRGMERDA